MTSLSEAQYIAQALAAMEQVKTDQELVDWDDTWAGSTETYLQMSDAGAKKLDEAYRDKAMQVWGVDW